MHAFVDESVRPGRYLLTAVVVHPRDLATLSRSVRAARPPGRYRTHLSAESDGRRRQILRAYSRLDVDVRVAVTACDRPNDEARER